MAASKKKTPAKVTVKLPQSMNNLICFSGPGDLVAFHLDEFLKAQTGQPIRLAGENTPATELFEHILARSLFGDDKLIILSEPTKEQRELLYQRLLLISRNSGLKLIITCGGCDKREKFYSTLAKLGLLRELSPVINEYGKEDYDEIFALKNWSISYLTEAGLQPDEQLIDYVLAMSSYNIAVAKRQYDKIKLALAIPGEPVDYASIVTNNIEFSFFKLIEHLDRADVNNALNCYHGLLSSLSETVDSISLKLLPRVKTLVLVSRYMQEGIRSEHQIVERLKLDTENVMAGFDSEFITKSIAPHPFVVSLMMKVVQRTGPERLTELYLGLEDLTMKLRGFESNNIRLSPETLFTEFIVCFCTGRRILLLELDV